MLNKISRHYCRMFLNALKFKTSYIFICSFLLLGGFILNSYSGWVICTSGNGQWEYLFNKKGSDYNVTGHWSKKFMLCYYNNHQESCYPEQVFIPDADLSPVIANLDNLCEKQWGLPLAQPYALSYYYVYGSGSSANSTLEAGWMDFHGPSLPGYKYGFLGSGHTTIKQMASAYDYTYEGV